MRAATLIAAKPGPSQGGPLLEGRRLCASLLYIAALSLKTDRGCAAVGAGAVDSVCDGIDGRLAEPPADGAGNSGALDFDGDGDDVDAPWASHLA